jgi:hypothetical protein
MRCSERQGVETELVFRQSLSAGVVVVEVVCDKLDVLQFATGEWGPVCLAELRSFFAARCSCQPNIESW